MMLTFRQCAMSCIYISYENIIEEPVEFENYPVEVQDFRTITHHFSGFRRTYLINEENQKIATCNWLDLDILES